MKELLQAIYMEGTLLSLLEIVAVITAIIYVFLASIGNRLCFIFGLISSIVYVYLSYSLKFYFDTGINTYYIFMSFYGWFLWSKQSRSNEINVLKMNKKKLLFLLLAALAANIILAYTVDRFSDAEYAYFDAFTTIFAILATWMVVKRYLENWLLWIVIDIVAAMMYFNKGLYLTAILFTLYTVIAIWGYFKWKALHKPLATE